MNFEQFINRIQYMDEKDTLDYIETYSREIYTDPDLDSHVVQMVLELSKKLGISDPDWERYYIHLCSTATRYVAILAIYELTH